MNEASARQLRQDKAGGETREKLCLAPLMGQNLFVNKTLRHAFSDKFLCTPGTLRVILTLLLSDRCCF